MPQITANGIRIEVESFGSERAPAFVLIAGFRGQLVSWEPALYRGLVDAGHRVVLFDNRDVGLTQHFDERGAPDLAQVLSRLRDGEPVDLPYTLDDMADDAIAVMDALGIERAHVAGQSMGGMIAQNVALRHRDRLHSLTSIYSATGEPGVATPDPAAQAVLASPLPEGRAEYIDDVVRRQRVFSGPGFPFAEAEVRERAALAFDRGFSRTGAVRQMLAVITAPSRKPGLSRLDLPSLVVHGDCDPLVPLAAGVDTARTIPGAQLLVVEGMGHAIPASAAKQRIVPAMVALAQRASR